MINIAIYGSKVKTTQRNPIDDLRTYVSSKEMARQNFSRRNGEGVLLSVLPGGSDYFLVQHEGDRIGVYSYEEIDYINPDTQDAARYANI